MNPGSFTYKGKERSVNIRASHYKYTKVSIKRVIKMEGWVQVYTLKELFLIGGDVFNVICIRGVEPVSKEGVVLSPKTLLGNNKF